MFVISAILAAATLANAAVFERTAACTTGYTPTPGWPQGITTTVCYDTSYYRAADQGGLSGSGDLSLVLQQKCEASCTSDSNCKAIVGATQYAADSNAATGVCYFYDRTPTPRQCTDSSKRAVRAENKNTVCPTTTTNTSTTKSTTKSTTTKSTTTTSTTTKSTTTTSSSTKSTTTSSSTTKSTTTSTASTTTTTKPTTTSSSTTTTPSTSNTTKPTTTTTSSSTTASTTMSSTTTSSTTTSSTTTSAATTTSSSTTSPSTTTTTTKAAQITHGLQCNGADASGNALGGGGCSANCVCDPDTDGGGRCTNLGGSAQSCSTDADCPSNEFCDNYSNPSVCLDSDGCSSTYTSPAKRDVFGSRPYAGPRRFGRMRSRKPLVLKE